MALKIRQPLLFAILILCLLGILDTLALLEIKYGEADMFACDIGTFSCTDVNNSEYSQLFGFPMAGLGLIGYAIMFLISALIFKKRRLSKGRLAGLYSWFATPTMLFSLATLAFVIQMILTLIEIFILHAYCIYCLISQALTLVIFILAYYYFFRN